MDKRVTCSNSPMDKRVYFVLNVLTAALAQAVATRHCPDCGRIPVPYPLSTGSSCGDPLYKVRCSSSTLWFDTMNGASYVIKSIDPLTQRIIIRPPGLANNSCVSGDYASGGINLDTNLPFNITGSNSVMLMNCTNSFSQVYFSLNCTEASLCHKYISGTPSVNAACAASSQTCCWFKTGGSMNEYRIKVREGGCVAYQSFIDLNPDSPVSKWPEPGMELNWELPQEPICNLSQDCQDLAKSDCLPDPDNAGQKRCFCLNGFRWDPINGVCQGGNKCGKKPSCKKKLKGIPLISGLTVSIGVMLFLIVALILASKTRKQTRKELEKVSLSKVRERILNVGNSGRMVKIFTRKEILNATNCFSKDRLLGSGGFGEVFKGTTDDGTIIAIKRSKLGSTKGPDQILNEVRILCHINHRSLVKLLGCCVELQEPLLIYEYISNGTLFEHIHCSGPGKRVPLIWHRRLVIAHQTADAIAYLHFSVTPPIYHRDIKSSNILIDDKLNAKVSDFGLSRLAVTDATHITTCAQGTLGYLDPEYYINFQLTDKSDVYSFGVVLLELLTSKKAIDFTREDDDVNLVVYVRKILKEERLTDVIDPFLKETASELELETMKALATLAASCLDDRRQNRPTIKEAADEIEHIISLIAPQLPRT